MNEQNQKADNSEKSHHFPAIHYQFELKLKDIFQILVGAFILAIPVAFTEEVWVLATELASGRVYFIGVMSVIFIAAFVYSNYYHGNLTGNRIHYIKRVFATYLVTIAAVGLFLTLIDKCPWGIDNILAIKRIILVSFPASMAATISDAMH